MQNVHSSRTVEVFIVDAHGAAGRALLTHRPSAESTHVLCRQANEGESEFRDRVLARTRRIQACRRIRALWYVIGGEENDPTDRFPLLDALMPMLEAGSSLTVVRPSTHRGGGFIPTVIASSVVASSVPHPMSTHLVSADLMSADLMSTAE